MAGRHHLKGPPGLDEHPIAQRLVCLYFGEPLELELCVIRSCRCGAQLWVSVDRIPLVESGDLLPTCWWCYESHGADATPRAATVDGPLRRRRLTKDWKRIDAALNQPGDPLT